MKKFITIATLFLATTMTANAGFFDMDDIEVPFADDNKYHNGMFDHNAYDLWDPRWYAKETENMFNKIDAEFNDDISTPWVHGTTVSQLDFPAQVK